MDIFHKNGIKIKTENLEISIDPLTIKELSPFNIYSHAHLDHINLTKTAKNKELFMTEITANVAKEYFGNFTYHKIKQNQKYNINNLKMKFYNSGHVPGSISIKIYGDKNIFITTDINTTNSSLTKAIKPVKTDILFVESTYGLPGTTFINKTKEYEKLQNWINKNIELNKLPIIFSYRFGKTQEIIKVINNAFNYKIGLKENTFNITKKISYLGLKNFYKINGNINDLDLLILPPHKITQDFIRALETTTKKEIAFANVTGQLNRFGTNFKISDHSDFNNLIDFVKKTDAKKVYTYHGHALELANELKKQGINANELKKDKWISI